MYCPSSSAEITYDAVIASPLKAPVIHCSKTRGGTGEYFIHSHVRYHNLILSALNRLQLRSSNQQLDQGGRMFIYYFFVAFFF
jgi:hypothetical protein